MKAGGNNKREGEENGQLQLFSNFMRFFGGYMGPQRPGGQTDSYRMDEGLTLKVFVPGLELRFLHPCHPQDTVSKMG
jgi:hypothetical protein